MTTIDYSSPTPQRLGGGSALVCVRPPGWVNDQSGPLDDLVAWAVRAEELGFDGVFVGDRLIGEAVNPDGAVVYGASMIDATVVLTAIAQRTSRILFGPLVLVFPYRHPIKLAKTFASLDQLSGGRLVLGAGIGWNAREFAALGIPMRGRAERFEEQVPLVRELWSGRPVDHAGPAWQFEGVQITPPPARPGGPPLWFASFSPGQPLDWTNSFPAVTRRQLERVGRLADGWVPLVYSASGKRRLSADALGLAWDVVLGGAQRVGRSRADLDFVFSDWCFVLDGPDGKERCRQALARFFDGTWEDALNTYTIGTPDEVLTKIQDHTRRIDRVDAYVLTPLGDDPSQLDLLAQIAQQLRT